MSFLSRYFEYTPHIYQKVDWHTHITMFMAIQLLPVALGIVFAIPVASIVLTIYYYILTAANIGVLLLAVYDNRKGRGVIDD